MSGKDMDRPDLSNLPHTVINYIEYLESLIGQNKSTKIKNITESQSNETIPINPEAPTTVQILTVSRLGFAKRTTRHHYLPQHRGGTGNPDFQIDSVDEYALLCSFDKATTTLLAFTNMGRVFRISVSRFEEKGIRDSGDWLWERIELDPGEKIAAILPVQATGFVAMVTRTGRIRTLRHHLFGEHMRSSMVVFSPMEHGELIAACWTPGDADLLVSTRNGMAIRFSEKIIPKMGDQSIKLSAGDEVIGLTSVYPDGEVFIGTADGRGALRTMEGFAPNKSMGGTGKILIKSNHVVGITSILPDDHIFMLTHQGKVIRFQVGEIPMTDAPVQGVNCMLLRNDEVISIIKSGHTE
jgi:DNA gyrase subunit A